MYAEGRAYRRPSRALWQVYWSTWDPYLSAGCNANCFVCRGRGRFQPTGMRSICIRCGAPGHCMLVILIGWRDRERGGEAHLHPLSVELICGRLDLAVHLQLSGTLLHQAACLWPRVVPPNFDSGHDGPMKSQMNMLTTPQLCQSFPRHSAIYVEYVEKGEWHWEPRICSPASMSTSVGGRCFIIPRVCCFACSFMACLLAADLPRSLLRSGTNASPPAGSLRLADVRLADLMKFFSRVRVAPQKRSDGCWVPVTLTSTCTRPSNGSVHRHSHRQYQIRLHVRNSKTTSFMGNRSPKSILYYHFSKSSALCY